MKTAALIACNNGYGHLRRLLIIYESLRKTNICPTIFAPIYKVKHLSKILKIKHVKKINFNSNKNLKIFSQNKFPIFNYKISSLENFDYVISDNLIEILNLRPDAIISGSFLFHENIEKISINLKNKYRRIIKKYNPKIISSKLFTSKYLKNYNNLYEVDLFHNISNRRINLSKKTDALISVGESKILEIEAKKFLKKIFQEKTTGFKFVWVENKLLPKKYPKWIKKATFNSEMYKRVAVSIIRPGIGSVTDSIFYGSKIFAFYEKNNLEMAHNSNVILEKKLGFDCSNIEFAWREAKHFINNKQYIKNYIKFTKKISFCGADQFVNIVI